MQESRWEVPYFGWTFPESSPHVTAAVLTALISGALHFWHYSPSQAQVSAVRKSMQKSDQYFGVLKHSKGHNYDDSARLSETFQLMASAWISDSTVCSCLLSIPIISYAILSFFVLPFSYSILSFSFSFSLAIFDMLEDTVGVFLCLLLTLPSILSANGQSYEICSLVCKICVYTLLYQCWCKQALLSLANYKLHEQICHTWKWLDLELHAGSGTFDMASQRQ